MPPTFSVQIINDTTLLLKQTPYKMKEEKKRERGREKLTCFDTVSQKMWNQSSDSYYAEPEVVHCQL